MFARFSARQVAGRKKKTKQDRIAIPYPLNMVIFSLYVLFKSRCRDIDGTVRFIVRGAAQHDDDSVIRSNLSTCFSLKNFSPCRDTVPIHQLGKTHDTMSDIDLYIAGRLQQWEKGRKKEGIVSTITPSIHRVVVAR